MVETDRRLPMLSEVVPLEKAVACPECGGFTFFDWGLKVLHRNSVGAGPRVKDWSDYNHVHVCANCHHPIVVVGGDFYDAIEFIPTETIEALIREGQARHHQVPVRAMDP
jgi:hypothetical protein